MSIRSYARSALLLACGMAMVAMAIPSLAQAVPMTGSLVLGNPSAGSTREAFLVNTTVTTSGTGTGRTIMLPAGQWDMSGSEMRIFPDFPSVAQNTEVFSSSHGVVTFAGSLGAGAIAWCPQATGCGGYTQGGVEQIFFGVAPGANVFGGAFRILRHLRTGSGAWFVINTGATPTKTIAFNPNLRGVSVTGMGATVNTPSSPWSAGITNFATVVDVNPPNQNYTSNFLTADGGIGTLGNFVGTSTMFDPPDGNATGFKMTTGSIFGSDATPTTTMGGPFTFTSMGYDNRNASGNGNIQLVGGAVAYGGLSGNPFFRTTVLRMAVPEPAALLGLATGLAGVAGLAAWRRRAS